MEGDGGWQGILKISWAQPHAFSGEEQELSKLLMVALSMHLGGLGSRLRLGATATDLELTSSITGRINTASTFDEVLRLLLLPAPANDEADIMLCAIESDVNGKPAWLTTINHLQAPGNSAPSQVGARYYLPDIPFAKLYLSSPDAPVLIGDLTCDDRVDDYARGLYTQLGVRSTIIIALTLQARWVGLLNIAWQRSMEFGEREQRVYEQLAKHAALRLDHTTMVERLRASLEETSRQGAVLRTVLDNIPVGIVYTESSSARPALSNPAAARLLGGPTDPGLPTERGPLSSGWVRPGSNEPYPDDGLPGARAMRTGSTQLVEFDVLTPDHDRRSLEGIMVPMHDSAGQVQSVVVVLSDVTARKRAEEERQRLQDEALRTQAALLAERSSPLIPITDDILVLPIIGSIDTERGHQMIHTVLSGASHSRARVAIIDITGVRTVDTQAAAALTNAAQALRLLGVIPVLTGIKAEVAQTLVGLGIRLEGIITHSTLQAGIQYALRRLGKSNIN